MGCKWHEVTISRGCAVAREVLGADDGRRRWAFQWIGWREKLKRAMFSHAHIYTVYIYMHMGFLLTFAETTCGYGPRRLSPCLVLSLDHGCAFCSTSVLRSGAFRGSFQTMVRWPGLSGLQPLERLPWRRPWLPCWPWAVDCFLETMVNCYLYIYIYIT